MIDGVGDHRADKCDFVDDAAGVRQKFRKLNSGLAVWFEREGRFKEFARLLLEMDFQIFVRVVLPIPFVEFRLGIEQIHLAWTAMLKEANNRFGFRREMGRFGGKGMEPANWFGSGSRRIHSQQMGEREVTESASGVAEERAAVHIERRWSRNGGPIHGLFDEEESVTCENHLAKIGPL